MKLLSMSIQFVNLCPRNHWNSPATSHLRLPLELFHKILLAVAIRLGFNVRQDSYAIVSCVSYQKNWGIEATINSFKLSWVFCMALALCLLSFAYPTVHLSLDRCRPQKRPGHKNELHVAKRFQQTDRKLPAKKKTSPIIIWIIVDLCPQLGVVGDPR